MGSLFRSAARIALLSLVVLAATARAAEPPKEFLLLDAGGKPVALGRVSVIGRTGSALTDTAGRFHLDPLPAVPFEIGVADQRGTWLGLLRVDALEETSPQTLRLRAGEAAEVIVRAGLAPATPAPPAAAATVVSRLELDKRRPNRLGNALESIPGLGRLEEGQSIVPTVRGMARSRVLLLLDDAPITAERRAGPSAGYLDPFSIENIEVVRGPGSVMYGSDSLGGVIHGRTPMPQLQAWKGRFALFTGAAGDRGSGIGLEANVPVGPGALLLQGHQRSFADYEDPDGTVDNSAARDRGLLVRALFPLGSSRIWAGIQIDQGRDQGKPALDSNVTRAYYPREDSTRFTLGTDLGGALGFSAFEIRAFYGTDRLVTDRVRRPTPTVTRRISEADIDAKDASLRLTGHRPLGRGMLRVGFDGKTRFGLSAIGRFTDFDAAGQQTQTTTEISVETARRINLGAFAETEQILIPNRLNASLGIRGDSVTTKNTGGYFGDRSTSNGAFSGFCALTVLPASRWSVTTQYSRGFRDPLLSDRYFRGVSGRGFVVGNPALNSEKSNQWDLAVRTSVGPVNLAAYGYLYRIVNLIERYQAGTDFNFRNRGREEITGAELEGDVKLSGGFTLRLGLTTCRGRILDDGSFAADIPPESASLSLDQRVNEQIWWGLRVFLAARDDAPGPTEKTTPGYGTMDLSAGYRFPFGIDVRVILRNLFDKKYPATSDAVAVNAPGRGVSFVVGGSF